MTDPPTNIYPTIGTLLGGLIPRTILLIMLAGTLSGAAFGAIVLLFGGSSSSSFDIVMMLQGIILIGCLTGTIGGIIGLLLGTLAGIACAIITIPITFLLFYPPTNKNLYSVTLRIITGLTAAATTYWVSPHMLSGLLNSPSTPKNQGIPDLIIPAIAGLYSLWISHFVTRWYLRQFQSQPEIETQQTP